MKLFLRITLLILLSIFTFVGATNHIVNALDIDITTGGSSSNLNLKTGGSNSSNGINNDALKSLHTSDEFSVSTGGRKGIYNTMVNIARDMKNVFYLIAGLYFLIIVVKLIFAGDNDEEISKFKSGILWISIGLIVTQIAFAFVQVLYDEGVSAGLAYNFTEHIIYPIIELLETGASFFFIAIAMFTFFRMITANGDEEKTKRGRYSIIYGMAGFIAVKFARLLVDSIYGKINCNDASLFGIINVSSNVCTRETNLGQFAQMVVTIINWMNSLVGIIVLILIIYSGMQVILSNGDSEALKKAKTSIMYIVLGIALLFTNYLILTFFIFPESTI